MTESETPLPVAATKKHKKRINYALAATLLASGLPKEEIAAKTGAKNWASLKIGLFRKGVTETLTKKLPLAAEREMTIVNRIAPKVATIAQEQIKEAIGERLLAQVGELSKKPVKRSGLANKGQGEAAVLKTLAETHRSLFGGAESQIMVFGASILDTTPQHIDIEANPALPEQAQSSQVADGE